MKVMLDTNVLFSGIIYGGKVAPIVVEYVSNHYDLYLPEHAIKELNRVTANKQPQKANEINGNLAKLKYTLLETPLGMPKNYLDMRDSDDIPILWTAVVNKMDILITGDKDFTDIVIKKPKIMIMSTFAEKYMKGVQVYGTSNSNSNMER
ncbi:MAG: putative toxin-antitoxin system toxin component, PIN family [Firmicutes bacterium]|nr:putative toxin-antitoxin system toxin component, PIN family [Bacillota bacterium]